MVREYIDVAFVTKKEKALLSSESSAAASNDKNEAKESGMSKSSSWKTSRAYMSFRIALV